MNTSKIRELRNTVSLCAFRVDLALSGLQLARDNPHLGIDREEARRHLQTCTAELQAARAALADATN